MKLITVNIDGYEVETKRDYFLIYKDGKFLESCDNGELGETINRLSRAENNLMVAMA